VAAGGGGGRAEVRGQRLASLQSAAAHFSKSARNGATPVFLVSDMNCVQTGASRPARSEVRAPPE
jgi:hypothetical protein